MALTRGQKDAMLRAEFDELNRVGNKSSSVCYNGICIDYDVRVIKHQDLSLQIKSDSLDSRQSRL